MVFSSAPAYLDPSIWQPQRPEHGGEPENTQVPPLLPPPPPVTATGGAGGTGKPSLMSDRARLAKLPLPEVALKCPRCESTNTKFCYFNNYNLSQPRHFCKACRRYWTRGGALRNVPVGGGCRRNNKKSKGGNKSKSPATNSPSIGPSRCKTDNLNHLDLLPPPKLPFFPSLHHLTDYGLAGPAVGNDIDLINIGSNYSQWRMQPPFPFSEGPNAGMYQIESDGASNYVAGGVTGDYFGCKSLGSGISLVDGGINMGENPHGLNLSKRFMDSISGADNQLWGISNPWSNASSSSTNHEL